VGQQAARSDKGAAHQTQESAQTPFQSNAKKPEKHRPFQPAEAKAMPLWDGTETKSKIRRCKGVFNGQMPPVAGSRAAAECG